MHSAYPDQINRFMTSPVLAQNAHTFKKFAFSNYKLIPDKYSQDLIISSPCIYLTNQRNRLRNQRSYSVNVNRFSLMKK